MQPRFGRYTLLLSASLIAVLACALPALGFAQTTGTVTGTVTRTDGQPLAEVMVTIQGTGRAVATNATGRYTLTHVPLGPQVLLIRLIGYAPDTMTVNVVAEQPTTADAVLEARPILLGDVVVQGVSRAPDRMIDAPAAVSVVQPATGEPVSLTGQIPVALARVPGLDLPQSGVTDFNVNARGFNQQQNRRMLVLQDGRDLSWVNLGYEEWGTMSLPLEDLGRIEVIRGPGSALYGANAFNGVINITTPAPRDIVGTKFTIGGGELGTTRFDLRRAGLFVRDRLGYRVNLGYTRSEDWSRSRTAYDGSDWKEEYAPATSVPPTDPPPEMVPLIGQTKDSATGRALGTPDPLVIGYGAARLDYYALNRSIVTLEGGAAQEDNRVLMAGNGRAQTPRLVRPWARLAWEGDRGAVLAWYSAQSYPQGTMQLRGAEPGAQYGRSFHAEGRANRPFQGDAGRFVAGASFQDNVFESTNFVQGRTQNQYYGAFGQLEYRVGRVRVIGALRWDDSDLSSPQLSPKGALVFTPAKNHALRVSVNQAFLYPTLSSLYLHSYIGERSLSAGQPSLSAIEATLRADPTVGPMISAVPNGTLFTTSNSVPRWTLGNPDLVPQEVVSYEAGYKGQLGWRAFVTLDAYAAHIKKFLTAALPGKNPAYPFWTPPDEVARDDWAAVQGAVQNALTPLPDNYRYGLTRLPDGTTAFVNSYANLGTVDEWGVELGTSVALTTALTLSASYTWYTYAIQDDISGDPLVPNTPEHKGTVALDYIGREGITLGAEGRFLTGYDWRSNQWDGYVPASQTVNLKAGYRINPHVRVYANATNLLDQQRFQFYGGSVNGRRVLVGMTSTF